MKFMNETIKEQVQKFFQQVFIILGFVIGALISGAWDRKVVVIAGICCLVLLYVKTLISIGKLVQEETLRREGKKVASTFTGEGDE